MAGASLHAPFKTVNSPSVAEQPPKPVPLVGVTEVPAMSPAEQLQQLVEKMAECTAEQSGSPQSSEPSEESIVVPAEQLLQPVNPGWLWPQ